MSPKRRRLLRRLACTSSIEADINIISLNRSSTISISSIDGFPFSSFATFGSYIHRHPLIITLRSFELGLILLRFTTDFSKEKKMNDFPKKVLILIDSKVEPCKHSLEFATSVRRASVARSPHFHKDHIIISETMQEDIVRTFTMRIMKYYLMAAGLILIGLMTPYGVRAQTMYSDLSAWEAGVGTWTETTNLGVPNGTVVAGVALSGGTDLTFVQSLQVESIGSGWATWCCGYSGNVLESYGTGSYQTENWAITPVSGFGMFIEPDPFGTFDITLTLSSGGTLTEGVAGAAGAQFFGWAGSGVTSLTISSTTDFAEGDFFSSSSLSPTPEPGTAVLWLTGIVLMIVTRKLIA
jgi:hypothetical protein